MTIKELTTMAKFGELRNLGFGTNAEETILTYINLGLLEIYKRFRISTKQVRIPLRKGQTTYIVPEDYMWMITAYADVQNGTVIEVVEIPVNNADSAIGVNTIAWNKIQVPATLVAKAIRIVYAAAPAQINYSRDAEVIDGVSLLADKYWSYEDGFPTPVTVLELPSQFVEPLLHYIGYRSYGAMNGSVEAENSTHYTRFDASCKRIEQTGMFTTEALDMASRVSDRCFV